MKLAIATLQTAGLLPTVYGLNLPKHYSDWVRFLKVFQIDWLNLIFPTSCLSGGFRHQLLLVALGPIALVAVVVVVGLSLGTRHGKPWRVSLLNTLPTLLLIAFCLTPSTSASIFATWSCESFQLDAFNGTHATEVDFLRADLSLRCTTSDSSARAAT